MIINSVLTLFCYNATWYNHDYFVDASQTPAPIGTMTFIIAITLLAATTVSYLLTLKTTVKDTIIESIISNVIYFGCIVFPMRVIRGSGSPRKSRNSGFSGSSWRSWRKTSGTCWLPITSRIRAWQRLPGQGASIKVPSAVPSTGQKANCGVFWNIKAA